MLSPRWRKVLRDLWNNKSRTLLVVISIAVGVFAIGMIAGTQSIISVDMPAAYAAVNPSSAILYTDPFDNDLLTTVRHVTGVAAAEGRRRISVRLQVGPGQWKDLRLEANDKLAENKVDIVRPEQGAWPPPDRQVLIERNSLPISGAKIGDTITVETPDGKLHELKIAGTTHDLNKPPAQFTNQVYGYVNFDTMQRLGFPNNYNEIHIVAAGDRYNKDHVNDVATLVKNHLQNSGLKVNSIYVPVKPGEHPANDIIQTFLLILGVLGLLALFLSGFLVVNTIMAILSQQIKQIGIMKAVGALTPQIVSMYLAGVFIYGLLSLLVAVPLGAYAAYAFSAYIASIVNFDPSPFRIPPQTALLEIGVGLVVPLLAALWPIFTGARISVREAFSTYGLGQTVRQSNPLDRALERVTLFSRPLLISLRNTFRRKGRLALTLFTLTLAGAIFVAVLTVQTSVESTLDVALNYWQYDIEVDLTEPHRVDQIAGEALSVPGVVQAESWASSAARRIRPDARESQNYALIAPPAATQMLRPYVLSGRWLLPDDQNAVVINTEVTKEESDVKVGDELTLKIDTRESKWRVVGIVRAVLTGPIMYANYPYFAEVTRTVGRASSVQVVISDHSATSQTAVANALKSYFENIGLKVIRASTIAQQRQTIEYQFSIIVVFMGVMAVLLAVVGGLGLMGTMSINVLERSREIGVMRAVGASDGAVLRIFLTEGLLIGLISWALGALFALPISRLLSDVVGIAFMRAPLTYTFATSGTLLWLGLVMLLAGLASFWPSWRAMRLSVREVLAYE
jgi:putative ABC transport system permease protein